MRGDLGLDKENGFFWINAAGKQDSCNAESVFAEHLGLLGDCDCVQVRDHGKYAVGFLELDPLFYRAQIVPDMEIPGGLDTA